MKRSTYDVVSTIAVVALVVFTVAAQHSSRAAYVFGVLAVLTAAGLFAAYIKASPDPAATSDQTAQAAEESQSNAGSEAEIAVQQQALMRNVRADLYKKLLVAERERASRVHEALYKEHLSERQLLLFLNAEHHGTTHLKASYYTRVRFHRDPAHDPASIIANIVEKLCASSKEPRFEFILEPDGRFKIQQISAKRAAVVGTPITPQEEPVEPPTEPEEPQLIH